MNSDGVISGSIFELEGGEAGPSDIFNLSFFVLDSFP